MKALNPIFIQFFILLLLTSSTIVSAEQPEWAQSAKTVEVTGELEVLYRDDFEHKQATKHYIVHDKKQGKRYELKFEGKTPKGATTGSFVRVRGKSDNKLILMEADGTESFETLATANVTASEERKTIVLMTDFNDATVSCSTQDIENTMFTDPNGQSINDLYKETSLNKVQFTGTVTGPYMINYSSTDTCDVYAFAQAADEQAMANGIDLSQYNHKVYILPKQNSCGWYGTGTLGGTPSKSWITQCDMPDVIAHELGHNLGMGHAGTPTGTYSDSSDIMGYSGLALRQINAPHQEQMGWRDPQQIIEINSSGTYNIAPLESDASNASAPQILKIRKPDTAEWYYLSYRQPVGFDASISTNYFSGLSIHQHAGDGSNIKTVWHDTLTDGEVFSDSSIELSITQLNHDANIVSIEVTLPYAPTTCTHNPPTVDTTPASQTDSPGSTLSYDLTIVNNDTAYCSDSTWMLATNIPSDWLDGLTNNSITLTPGESATINWQVTSQNTAADSNYALSINLADIEAITHDSSTIVNYTVTTPVDTQPPTIPAELNATIVRKRSISVNWLPSTDNNQVAGYRIYRNNIEIATTTSTSYSDRDLTNGETYTYYTKAFDADNNISSPSNASSVTYGNTKGGGKKK